jgi:hypothetical protein
MTYRTDWNAVHPMDYASAGGLVLKAVARAEARVRRIARGRVPTPKLPPPPPKLRIIRTVLPGDDDRYTKVEIT